MRTILIVDDEATSRYATRRALEHKYRTVEADSAAAARVAIAQECPDLVLLDVVMPEEDGISFLQWMGEHGHEQPVIVLSALDTAKTAVDALQRGATDYLVKGCDIEELRRRVANVLKIVDLAEENESLRRATIREGNWGAMIGSGAAMRAIFEMAERIAPTDATVLITGESGTGKDLLAQEIHRRSPRAEAPFVAVNCAALPENLIESELFGYEKGAFTGAANQKKGKFELASGGTIFLDEIGDMNPVTQAKVLRVLENRLIERLGGTQPIPVDVRVISATHRDLPASISSGKFREDLFFRLRVLTVEVPPLRARREDVAPLCNGLLRSLGAHHGRPAKLSPEALALLEAYPWPGNVRELKNALERSMILARGETIGPEDLPLEIRSGDPAVRSSASLPRSSAADAALGDKDFREARRKFEVAYFEKRLAENNWNISRTAAVVGLHRQSLQEKLRELGIQRPGKATANDE